MKVLLLTTLITLQSIVFAQNQLVIPTLLTGPTYDLELQTGTHEFFSGVTTNTMGANGNLLGPTLYLTKGDNVTINVDNQLGEETTIHWHGLHVSPENDGGPHTVIPAGTVWSPSFEVLDKAGTFWYHPHLHMKTDEHVSKGIAGMIIVHDAEELGLGLPVTYGVDDIPLVLQTKGFDASGQIEIHTEGDTTVMVNGILEAYTELPAQVVRLRLLNGSTQRVMEIGFSDDRQFSIIATDGGLLTAPVVKDRFRLAPGQRVEVLLDLTTALGQNFQLMSFGSELPNAIYGATQPGMGPGATIPGYDLNPLNGADYQLLDITVGAQTASPIVTIPAALASFTPIPEVDAVITRGLTFTSTGGMGNLQGPFVINGMPFDMMMINYTIPLNNAEIWSLTNQTPIAHPFHIHDVQFFILDINGVPPPPELSGYHDVVLVPAGMGNVRFIAKFEDHSHPSLPYMYHCHMLTHEDNGMMGQFLVVDQAGVNELDESNEILLVPNPSVDQFELIFSQEDLSINGVRVFNSEGKEVFVKLEGNKISHQLQSGLYSLEVSTDSSILRKSFIVN
jgi:bilirubin oxidase